MDYEVRKIRMTASELVHLLDHTITHYKHKVHPKKGYKKKYCEMVGLPYTIESKELLVNLLDTFKRNSMAMVYYNRLKEAGIPRAELFKTEEQKEREIKARIIKNEEMPLIGAIHTVPGVKYPWDEGYEPQS